jgi:hypothetical protein
MGSPSIYRLTAWDRDTHGRQWRVRYAGALAGLIVVGQWLSGDPSRAAIDRDAGSIAALVARVDPDALLSIECVGDR